ncbi:DUF4837 family protein [Flavobacterium succinicans]|uniref:DUF4837 domain-containing protein n=1 Tax=Flavobacterium succinicans TaxID=29536 RepID=A0A199XRC2_9FLAO|nr:DUF4837 family protein [Flavobacterium succinicans]OAZ03796.1 hypothetical protein FLB_20740 [Flavobacterium succinicans]
MNRAHFLCLFVSLILFSCAKKQEPLLRGSVGKINTIAVIMNDALWNGEVGDSLRNKLAAPVFGLPQEEPLFTINQYPDKLVEGFVTDSRTIVVVKKGVTTSFEIKKNQYATPQTVFHLTGTTNDTLLYLLEKHSAEMIRLIKEGEIQANQKSNRESLLNPKIIENKFHIRLDVPSDFEYALQKPRFIWLKKEIVSGSMSLLLYQVPLNTIQTQNPIASIIRMRDSIGKLYIKGREEQTPMITGEGYAPYWFTIKLDHRPTFETKGTWELKNDFMSGPFINYVIFDKEYNRIMVLEGFCYSPADEKREVMFALESIIKSVKISKRKHKN